MTFSQAKRRALLARFASAEAGGVAPMLTMSALALLGVTGIAVDFGRAQVLHARLLNAADAAGLAAGARLDTSKPKEQVQKFLDANFPEGYIGATVTGVDVEVSDNEETITTTVQATMPTTFMSLFGFDDLTVSARSEVTRESSGLEVALVLDNTGSMAGQKLTDMKAAAHDLLGILFGDKQEVDHLYVSVVPFAQTVRIGTEYKSWLSDFSPLDWSASWDGCVEAQDGTNADGMLYDTMDDPPSVKKLSAYALRPWMNEVKVTISGKVYYGYKKVNDLEQKSEKYVDLWTKWNHWIAYSCSKEIQYKGSTYCEADKLAPKSLRIDQKDGQGPRAAKCIAAKIQPLTRIRGQSESTIANMKADGMTHINFGAVWGFRMLSPRWRGLWNNKDSQLYGLPLDYHTDGMKKAVVIMTDGDNTFSNVKTIDDQTDGDFEDGQGYRGQENYRDEYTAYGYLQQGRLGTTTSVTDARAELDKRLEDTCGNMKAAGIVIYTVSFGAPSEIDEATKAMLRRCASQPNFYWHAPTGAELKIAFEQIGESLANLRVSR